MLDTKYLILMLHLISYLTKYLFHLPQQFYYWQLLYSITAVSYTHLDVYKRQVLTGAGEVLVYFFKRHRPF